MREERERGWWREGDVKEKEKKVEVKVKISKRIKLIHKNTDNVLTHKVTQRFLVKISWWEIPTLKLLLSWSCLRRAHGFSWAKPSFIILYLKLFR